MQIAHNLFPFIVSAKIQKKTIEICPVTQGDSCKTKQNLPGIDMKRNLALLFPGLHVSANTLIGWSKRKR